ncbi:hypothetical protein ACFX13_007229 [Malus domestica]
MIATPEVSHLGWGHRYTLRELEDSTNGFAESRKECKEELLLAPPSPEQRLCSGLFSFNQIPVNPFGSIDMVEWLVAGFGNCAKKRAAAKRATSNFFRFRFGF